MEVSGPAGVKHHCVENRNGQRSRAGGQDDGEGDRVSPSGVRTRMI